MVKGSTPTLVFDNLPIKISSGSGSATITLYMKQANAQFSVECNISTKSCTVKRKDGSSWKTVQSGATCDYISPESLNNSILNITLPSNLTSWFNIGSMEIQLKIDYNGSIIYSDIATLSVSEPLIPGV